MWVLMTLQRRCSASRCRSLFHHVGLLPCGVTSTCNVPGLMSTSKSSRQSSMPGPTRAKVSTSLRWRLWRAITMHWLLSAQRVHPFGVYKKDSYLLAQRQLIVARVLMETLLLIYRWKTVWQRRLQRAVEWLAIRQ